MAARFLILGSGFVGAELKKDLGQEIIGVSRTGANDLKLDLSLKSSYDQLPKDVESIIFALSPDDSSLAAYQKVYNEILTLSLDYTKKLKHIKKFIFISSTGVYGQDDGTWVDEQTIASPLRETAKIILEAENFILKSNINSTILRFGGIYGPGRESLINLAKLGEMDSKTCLFSNRIHVADCSRLIQFAISKLEGLFIGVDNQPCDKREVLHWLRFQLRLEEIKIEQAEQIRGKRCSNRKILDAGFKFKYPSFKEGYLEMLT